MAGVSQGDEVAAAVAVRDCDLSGFTQASAKTEMFHFENGQMLKEDESTHELELMQILKED